MLAILAGVLLSSAVFLFQSGPAVVCGCCVVPGTWEERTGRLTPEVLSEIGRIALGGDAILDVDAPGADDSKAPGAERRYVIRHNRPHRGWTLELLDENDKPAGALEFVIPDRGTLFAVDLPRRDGEDPTGLLYKEWRVSGPVRGTGVVGTDGSAAATFQLILQGWGDACPDAARFTRWRLRVNGPRLDYTLRGLLAPADERPGDTLPLYFDSPASAVGRITDLLRREDWRTLARYYDLTETSIAREELTSGRFFLNRERPANAHPGLPWKYRHPFTPGFQFSEAVDRAEAFVVTVVMTVAIDQGDGRVQRGFQEFAMRRSGRGYQILPPDLERIR
jgi:hypothetical protein